MHDVLPVDGIQHRLVRRARTEEWLMRSWDDPGLAHDQLEFIKLVGSYHSLIAIIRVRDAALFSLGSREFEQKLDKLFT
jgi:hypothetical protein